MLHDKYRKNTTMTQQSQACTLVADSAHPLVGTIKKNAVVIEEPVKAGARLTAVKHE